MSGMEIFVTIVFLIAVVTAWLMSGAMGLLLWMMVFKETPKWLKALLCALGVASPVFVMGYINHVDKKGLIHWVD